MKKPEFEFTDAEFGFVDEKGNVTMLGKITASDQALEFTQDETDGESVTMPDLPLVTLRFEFDDPKEYRQLLRVMGLDLLYNAWRRWLKKFANRN